jgi:hypothetical protein
MGSASLSVQVAFVKWYHRGAESDPPEVDNCGAVGVTRERCWKYDWVLEFDIKGPACRSSRDCHNPSNGTVAIAAEASVDDIGERGALPALPQLEFLEQVPLPACPGRG